MGFLGRLVRGIGDVVAAPFKAIGQVGKGIGKGFEALSKGDIGGFFTEPLKGVLKGGGELVKGALSGVSGVAGPLLTVAGGVAGFCLGGPFGAAAGASLGGMLGGAIGNVAGGLSDGVGSLLGEGCQRPGGSNECFQQQNYNDFGGQWNGGMPGNCGCQLPYSFYQGAPGYPGSGGCGRPSWNQPQCWQPPYQYNLAPEIARFYC